MDVLTRAAPPADDRLHYGTETVQFGDLRLPKLNAGEVAPVVVFVHGGWWKAKYGLEYGGHLCEALRKQGVATWSIEYRRVGDVGGGWPGTFEDVAAGYEYLAEVAKRFPLDLDRVVVCGHSAGGHLAFWLAGRTSRDHAGKSPFMLRLRGAVALAGAVGLRMTIDLAGVSSVRHDFAHDRDEVYRLMGGSPAEHPERYMAGDPAELLPFGVPQLLIQGTEDDQIPPELPGMWAERSRGTGDTVRVEMIDGADHLDVVDPESRFWGRVEALILEALASSGLSLDQG